jgi:hypothetical protein
VSPNNNDIEKRLWNRADDLGVALREFPLTTSFADYLLAVDRAPAGIVAVTVDSDLDNLVRS